MARLGVTLQMACDNQLQHRSSTAWQAGEEWRGREARTGQESGACQNTGEGGKYEEKRKSGKVEKRKRGQMMTEEVIGEVWGCERSGGKVRRKPYIVSFVSFFYKLTKLKLLLIRKSDKCLNLRNEEKRKKYVSDWGQTDRSCQMTSIYKQMVRQRQNDAACHSYQ